MEFEDIIHQVCGYGRYQKKLIVLFLVPVSFIMPWFWLNLIFMLSVPEHWCRVPESVVSANLSYDQHMSINRPPNDPSCSMYRVNYTSFLYDGSYGIPNDSEIVPCSDGWIYDKRNYDATAGTKWNMVCTNSHYPSLIFTLTNVGSLFGTPMYGFLSDKFGRKVIFLCLAVVVSASELASLLVEDFVTFACLRTINGSVLPSMFSLYYILIIELVAPNLRTHIFGMIHVFYTLGICALALVAYLSRHWIRLGLITALSGISILCYCRFLPESPCWLLSQNRCAEASSILLKIAKDNEKPQNQEDILKQLTILSDKNRNQKEKESKNKTFLIFKYHRLRKHFLILCFCWIASNVAYNGLFYNTRNFNGNEFLNFLLVTVVELPGILLFWFSSNHIGRRWTITFGYFAVAVVCLMPFMEFPSCDIISSTIGKFLIAGTFMVTDLQGSEMFPTANRSFAVGTGKSVATAVTLLVPFIADLSALGRTLPFVIIGITCLIASTLACFLPETLDKNMPQTASDADEFGKDQKFFSWNRNTDSTILEISEQTRF